MNAAFWERELATNLILQGLPHRKHNAAWNWDGYSNTVEDFDFVLYFDVQTNIWGLCSKYNKIMKGALNRVVDARNCACLKSIVMKRFRMNARMSFSLSYACKKFVCHIIWKAKEICTIRKLLQKEDLRYKRYTLSKPVNWWHSPRD